jgi:RNA chaperone Hfq
MTLHESYATDTPVSSNETYEYEYLQDLKDSNQIVNIYLVNSIKLEGHIVELSHNVIFLKNSILNNLQMIYKHGILTVCPKTTSPREYDHQAN